MKSYPKVVVVMPAYNAAKTLKRTYIAIPKKIVSEVILVDDSSHDETVKIANSLSIKTFVHKYNKGYGGNQKTCYRKALELGADIVVMIHPDYQYDPRRLPQLIKPIIEGRFDIMLGSRIRTRNEALSGGMPRYKYYGNRFLTLIQNIILGQNLSEYHTGFRAFSKEALKKLPINKFSNDFVFDQQILICAIRKNLKIGEVHVDAKYKKDSSSINFIKSLKYGMQTLLELVNN